MDTLSRREEETLLKTRKALALKECDDLVKRPCVFPFPFLLQSLSSPTSIPPDKASEESISKYSESCSNILAASADKFKYGTLISLMSKVAEALITMAEVLFSACFVRCTTFSAKDRLELNEFTKGHPIEGAL